MISIVMPTYNQSEYIREAIDSIHGQSYRDWELIVVNDGCTDRTAEIIEGYTDPRISVLRKANGGTGAALNMGFAQARGELETWFASDNVMYQHNLKTLVQAMTPEADFVYADCDVTCSKTGKKWLYSDGHPKKTIEYRWGGIVEKVFFPSIMWLWRRSLRERAGGLFTSMPCEDTDMILRMEEVGRFKYLGKRSNGFYRLKNEASLTGIQQPFAQWGAERLRQNARARRMRNKVSIQMPVYNREKSVMRALSSCLRQTYQNIEVVVVDDGSTDGTLRVARALATKDERIRVFAQAHAGCCAARNEAIQRSTGGYVALLDSDDYDEPTRIEKSLRLLQSAGLDFVTCGARVHFEDGTTEDYMQPLEADRMVRGDLLAIPVCPSVVFRRSLIDRVGAYNEVVEFGEDADLLTRFVVAGAKYGFLAEPLYHYQRGPDQLSKAHSLEEHEALRDERVRKYAPLWEARHAVA